MIRAAKRSDIKSIMSLIMELAEHVNGVELVEATEERLTKWIFDEKIVKGLVAEEEGKVIGYCIYFYNFSSFLGKIGIHIEDICVSKDSRGNGTGKAFFKKLAEIAKEKGCGRIEWECLTWNTNSIEFYKKLGAKHQKEQMIFRLDEEQITKMSK